MNWNEFIDFIRTRRSIRKFTDQRPDRSQIERLIEAAGWAPSNHNRQGWKFIIFEDREQIRNLSRQIRNEIQQLAAGSHRLIASQAGELVHFSGVFEEAPVVILAMHKRAPAVGKTLAGSIHDLHSGEALSTAMGVQNLLLAAHVLGLGACVMTAPLLAREVWASRPDLPAGFELTCLVAVGFPAESPEPPRRKKLEHLLEYR